MKRIGQYLNTTVTINRITLVEGDRTETPEEDVPAAVFTAKKFVQTPEGVSYIDKTFVGLKSDETISGQDEIIIDDIKYPIANIDRVRESRYSSAIDHIEVELG